MKNISEEFYPVALTIAGSDSGGGAGIQADLRTFSAAGIYGCSVITAVTAQNPRRVAAWEAVNPDLVRAQYESVVDAMEIKAAKTGMLGSAPVVKVLVKCLQKKHFPLVVDPVMIATSGAHLLDRDALEVVKNEFLPLAEMITPNLPEAEWLLGSKLEDEQAYVQGARQLAERYRCNVLLKTGHGAVSGNKINDVLILDGKAMLLGSPRVDDLDKYASHGTGCTLSSAIAGMLARGEKWKDALLNAKSFVYGSLCELAHTGRDLDCMYPPLDDYSGVVSLRAVDAERAAGRTTRRQK